MPKQFPGPGLPKWVANDTPQVGQLSFPFLLAFDEGFFSLFPGASETLTVSSKDFFFHPETVLFVLLVLSSYLKSTKSTSGFGFVLSVMPWRIYPSGLPVTSSFSSLLLPHPERLPYGIDQVVREVYPENRC